MVFATTTRDLTVSAANRPRTAAQVEVCVIRTHHRRHQTVHFPYQIATNRNLFALLNSVSLLKNQDYLPRRNVLPRATIRRFSSLLLSKQWSGEKRREVGEFRKNWKSRIDRFERNSFDNRRLGYELLFSLNLN